MCVPVHHLLMNSIFWEHFPDFSRIIFDFRVSCFWFPAGKPCGVDYELKAFVGDHIEDKPHKRNSVRLAIRKIMYAPSKVGEQPSIEVSKEFMMKPNKIHLEASLDKEVMKLGEQFLTLIDL